MLVGHELLHRREKVHKIFGTLIFGKSLYAHYFIAHVRGHHKYLGTERDSSTARLNQSFYAFCVRAIPLGIY